MGGTSILLLLLFCIHRKTFFTDSKAKREKKYYNSGTKKKQLPSGADIIEDSVVSNKMCCGIIGLLTCIEVKLVRHIAAGDNEIDAASDTPAEEEPKVYKNRDEAMEFALEKLQDAMIKAFDTRQKNALAEKLIDDEQYRQQKENAPVMTTSEKEAFKEKYESWFDADAAENDTEESRGKVDTETLLRYVDDHAGTEIQARLKGYWLLLATVGALFAAIAYGTFTSYPVTFAPDGSTNRLTDLGEGPAKDFDYSKWFFGLLLGASTVAGLCCVVLCAIYYAYLNTIPGMHTLTWVVDFLPILCFPMITLMGCWGTLGLSVFFISWYVYGAWMVIAGGMGVAFMGSIALCLLYFCFSTTRGFEETKPVKFWNLHIKKPDDTQEVEGRTYDAEHYFDFDRDVLKKSIVNCFLFRILCSNEIRMLRVLKDPEVLYDRLISYWGLIGFLNAIIGTLAFAVFAVPPDFYGSGVFWLKWLMGFFLAAGFMMGLGGVVLSSFYCVLLNTIPKIHAYEWTVNMLPILSWPTLMFLGSCCATAFGFLCVALGCYGWVVFAACFVIGPISTCLVLYVGFKLNYGVEYDADLRASVWQETGNPAAP